MANPPKTDLFDASELYLAAELGIYGCWLLKHSPNLPEGKNDAIKEAYAKWLARGRSCGGLMDKPNPALDLFDAIIAFCIQNNWEFPIQDFDKAWDDVYKTRQRQRNGR